MQGKLYPRDMLIAIVHSLVFFIIAYLIIWVFQSATTVLIANGLEIPTVWYYHRIDFMIPESKWSADLVKLTYSGAPLISLALAILCLIAYYSVMQLNGILKLLFLWGYVHGWAGFFGSVFVGTLTSTGFGHVVVWLYFNDTARLATNLFSLFMLLFGGFIIARPTLISANYYLNYLPVYYRNRFLMTQIILPALIGLTIISALRLPASPEELLIPATSLLVILPVFLRRYQFPELYFEDEPIHTKLEWIYPVILLIFIATFRLLFEVGIRSGN